MILDELKLHGLIKEKIENLSYKLHLKSNGDYNSELIMLHLANSELLEFTEVLNKKRSITSNKSNYPIKVATYLYDTSKLSELMLRVENPKCKDILSIVVLHSNIISSSTCTVTLMAVYNQNANVSTKDCIDI